MRASSCASWSSYEDRVDEDRIAIVIVMAMLVTVATMAVVTRILDAELSLGVSLELSLDRMGATWSQLEPHHVYARIYETT